MGGVSSKVLFGWTAQQQVMDPCGPSSGGLTQTE